MKRLALFSLPLVFFCASCVLVFPFDGLTGNGDVVSRNLALSSFDSIQNHTSAKVFVRKGSQAKASITIDENLLEALDVRVDFGTLVIATKPGKSILSSTRFVVDVSLPSLEELKAYGSGSIVCEDSFSGRKLELSSSGSADLSGTFDYEDLSISIAGSGDVAATLLAEELSLRIDGSGDIVLKGRTDDVEARINGSGDIAGRDFSVRRAQIGIFGSGSATFRVQDWLKVVIGGSGDVNYYGNPYLDSRSSGSGRVRRLGS
ncbi:MAG: head GIN domain-containing protein [Spirochaetia bacterium]|nr:head GIN domain-containing protein [Spirochaetia bacterium]